MKNNILIIDQGTTATKVSIYNKNGDILASITNPIKQFFPSPGWVEHDPIDIFHSITKGIRELIDKSGINPRDIVAVGIDNQGETVVAFNRFTGEPLHNAIVWQDSRTANECELLRKNYDERILTEKTGLFFDPYFSATKIAWLIKNVDKVKKAVKNNDAVVATSDVWILYKLSGGKIIKSDVTTASRTAIFNINELKWDDELLDLYQIPISILPSISPTVSNFGNCDPEICSGVSAPILASCVDQQASLFGHGCLKKGEAKITYGTGGFLLLNIGEKRIDLKDRIITTLTAQYGDNVNYAIDGGVYCVGSCINWLKDRLGIILDAKDCDSFAYSIDSNEGVYFIPSLAGLSVPHWESNLKGAFFGLSLKTGKAHFVRAVLESIAYRFYEIINIIKNSGYNELLYFSVDGGVSNSDFLMQFQSDLTDVEIRRPKCKELTSLGTFYLAALKAGLFSNIEDIKDKVEYEKVFYPNRDKRLYENYILWKKAIEHTIGWYKDKSKDEKIKIN